MKARILVGIVVLGSVFSVTNKCCAWNQPPEVSLTSDADWAVIGKSITVTFDGSGSYDPGGSGGLSGIHKFAWDFGNGQTYWETADYHPDGQFDGIHRHTYSNMGDYEITLTAYDNSGLSASTSADLGIRDKIQDAIDAASSEDNDRVVVTPGWYTGQKNWDLDFSGKAITVESIDPSDTDIVATTVIYCFEYDSGRLNHRGFYFHNGEDSDSVVAGFTVKEGYQSTEMGGGIYCKNSSPTIANCTFVGNYSSGGGGGIGIHADSDATPTPTVNDCVFITNESGKGGGIAVIGDSSSTPSPTVNNCIFTCNTAKPKGGGMYIELASPTIVNCVFNQNEAMPYSANGQGGGVYNDQSLTKLVNCTFYGNLAYGSPGYGGGIFEGETNPTTQIVNCILWGNGEYRNQTLEYDESAQIDYLPSCKPTVNYSCVQGWTGTLEGTGNIGDDLNDDNPRFVNTGDPLGPDGVFATQDDGLCLRSDAHPTYGYSDCIDGGGSGDPDVPDEDVTGRDRSLDGNHSGSAAVDMGAYEAPPVWFVDKNITSGNDGKSWDTAFEHLQDALAVDDDGDEIWVAAGTYKPDQGGGQTPGDQEATFDLDDGVSIYGGFAGTEHSRVLRNWIDNKTILSGDLGGNKSEHVVTGTILTNSTILDGLTISDGDAGTGYGGGMTLFGASLTVQNCTFSSNSAKYGGGIRNYFLSHATYVNCLFSDNSADEYGGAIYCYNSSPTLVDCTFEGNQADYTGGLGGAVFSTNGGTPKFRECIFSGNKAGLDPPEDSDYGSGGAMYFNNTSAVIENCIFAGNSGGITYYSSPPAGYYGYGGAICNWYGSSPVLTNCVFAGNNAGVGGGIYNYASDSNPTLTNCTFSKNSAGELDGGTGGGIHNESSDPILTNCILWGNTAGNGSEDGPEIFNASGDPTISYCDIKGSGGSGDGWDSDFGTDMGGNLDLDPSFIDADDADGPDGIFRTDDDGLRLGVFDPRHGYLENPFEGSCLDSAYGSLATAEDITGRSRVDIPYIPNSGGVNTDFADMGAYESPCVWYVKKDAGNGKGWSWEYALDDLQKAIEVARPGDEIWVASGIYTPSSLDYPNARAIAAIEYRAATFYIDKAIEIYGGFAGTEYARHKRDWVARETILSGELGGGSEGDDNCFHVMIIASEGVVLDGLVVMGGYDEDPGYCEGDICEGSGGGGSGFLDTETLRFGNGAGIFIDKSSPTIKNCMICDNYAHYYGGGICVDQGAPIIEDCKFLRNEQRTYGPSGGEPYRGGGGLYSYYNMTTGLPFIVKDCIFSWNRASDGGAINSDCSDLHVVNCIFKGNFADEKGGAIFNRGYYAEQIIEASLIATNCVLTGNYADHQAAVYSCHSALELHNDTFASNSTGYENVEINIESVYINNSNSSDYVPVLTNCIFWGDTSDTCDKYQVRIENGPSPYAATVQNCDSGPTNGVCVPTNVFYYDNGNISSDPDFVAEPELYDETIGVGSTDVIVVDDATKYEIGDIIEYDADGIAREVIGLDYDNQYVTFDLHLASASQESRSIKNWGKCAILQQSPGEDIEVTEEIARVIPDESPCIDAGTDEGTSVDIYDLDEDGIRHEKLSRDIIGVPRLQEIPGYGTSGTSIDIGAFESGGLVAYDQIVSSIDEDETELINLTIDNDPKGGTVTYVIVTEPKNGTLSYEDTSEKQVKYKPNQDIHGSGGFDEFYYKPFDGTNLGELTKVTISEVVSKPDAPIAVDDEAWINPDDESIIIDVLANDYDPDSDTEVLTLASVGDPYPSCGEAQISNGKIEYSPCASPQDVGFDYTIEDSTTPNPLSGTGHVTVRLNSAPTPGDDPESSDYYTTNPDKVAVLNVLTNDSDPDGHNFEIATINQSTTVGQVVSYAANPDMLLYIPDSETELPYTTSFTYTIKDEYYLESTAAQVDIKVSDTVLIQDTDDDSISDADEELLGTDPDSPDSDGDGVFDAEEILGGFDPLNPSWGAHYADTLPYITCFQPNQGYVAPQWDSTNQISTGYSLNGQRGWKVDNGTCTVEYIRLREYDSGLGDEGPEWPPFGGMVARLSAGGTVISKEFEDNGSSDNLSNMIKIKLYPSEDAYVKVLFDGTCIAGARFVDGAGGKIIEYWNQTGWDDEDSDGVWTNWPNPACNARLYEEHDDAMVLKFTVDFSSGTYNVYWDASGGGSYYDDDDIQLLNSEDVVIEGVSLPTGGIDKISHVQFASGTAGKFDVRGLCVNEFDSPTIPEAEITFPFAGDSVQTSNTPVKGWIFHTNMSQYALVALTKHPDDTPDEFNGEQLPVYWGEGEIAPIMPSGQEANARTIGYWNTAELPKGLYYLGVWTWFDLMEEYGDSLYPVQYNATVILAQDIATSGVSRNSTFHLVEEPDISVPWPGLFPFELRRIYDSGRHHVKEPFYPGWTNNNQIILTEYAGYYESKDDVTEKTVKGDPANEDSVGLAFGAIYVQYEDGSMHLFRHTTGNIATDEATYVPYPDDGSGDYIIRTTDGAVSFYNEYDQLIVPGLRIDYELYRRDGTKIVFHQIHNYIGDGPETDDNKPLAIEPYTDGSGRPVVPLGGAVHSAIPYVFEDHWEGIPWQFVTAVKTKTDRLGNTLHYEQAPGEGFAPAVVAVHYDYNGDCAGDISSDDTKISIELDGLDGNYCYSTAKLLVDGDLRRWIGQRLLWYNWTPYWPADVLEVCRSDNLNPQSPGPSMHGTTGELIGDYKDVTVYEYNTTGSGRMVTIFNNKLEYSNGQLAPVWPARRTEILYDWDRNVEFKTRIDYVDEQTYRVRDNWYFFYEPDSGNELDGQCIFTSTDVYDSVYGMGSPYMQEWTIVNEQGQVRAKCVNGTGHLSKVTLYDYYEEDVEEFYGLPFTPHKIREFWHEYDYEQGDFKEVGRIIVNDWERNELTFNSDTLTEAYFYNPTKQEIYSMGYDATGLLDDKTLEDENLISYSETDYHDYFRYNLPTKQISYQKLDKEEPISHSERVETRYVYGQNDGQISSTDEENKYLVAKKTLIADDPSDVWVETNYTYHADGGMMATKIEPYGVGDASSLERAKTYYDYDQYGHKMLVEIGTEGQSNEKPVERYYYNEIGELELKADAKGLVTRHLTDGYGDPSKTWTYHDPDAFAKTDLQFVPETYEPDTEVLRSMTIYSTNEHGQVFYEKTFTQEMWEAQYAGPYTDPPINDIEAAVKMTEYTVSYQPKRILLLESQSAYEDYAEGTGGYTSSVEYAYAGHGQRIAEMKYDSGAEPGRQWRCIDYYYDTINRLRATLWYDYENMDLLRLATTFYHGSGKKAYETVWGADAEGWWELQGRTDYKYDHMDRLIESAVTYDYDGDTPLQSVILYGYDDTGNRTGIRDPEGNCIFFDYDNSNRQIKEYFAVEYDDTSLETTRATYEGPPSTLEQRKTVEYYENGSTKVATSYDYGGTAELAVTSFEYDERGRATEVIEKVDATNDAETDYTYYDAGEGIEVPTGGPTYSYMVVTDAESKDTTVVYNELGKTIEVQYPSGQEKKAEYCGDGNLARRAVWSSEAGLDKPTPDPAEWASGGEPAEIGTYAITMTAKPVYHWSGVEYYFACTAGGGHDSGWQSENTYTDVGLVANTQYKYKVKLRHGSTNWDESNYSQEEDATTETLQSYCSVSGNTTYDWIDRVQIGDIDNDESGASGGYANYTGSYATYLDIGTPYQVTLTQGYGSGGPYYEYWRIWIDLNMDGDFDSENELLFDEYTNASTTECTGTLTIPAGTYLSSTRMRVAMSACQPTPCGPWGGGDCQYGEVEDYTVYFDTTAPAAPAWSSQPDPTSTTSITMTATTVTDPSSVEYYFECTSGGGHDSGWQVGNTYEDTGLTPNTTYTYKVKARDKSPNHNQSGYSSAEQAATSSGDSLYWVDYYYDTFARLAEVSYPDGTVTYVYDGFGKRVQFVDNRNEADNIGGSGVISYEYDALDRLVKVTDQDSYDVLYSYRSDGQKQSVSVAHPTNPDDILYVVQYDHDLAGRLTNVTEPLQSYGFQELVGFDYDDNGNRSQTTYYLTGQESGSTVDIGYTYNDDNMMTGYSTTSGPTFTFDASAAGDIDGLGRLLGADETISKTSGTVEHIYTLGYDSRSQLTDASITNIGGSTWSDTYSYYDDGNLKERQASGSLSYSGDLMTANNLDSLSSLVGHWKLDENDGGNQVADSSGQGNTGQASKSTSSFHSDNYKKGTGAFDFDGDDNVNCGHGSSLNITNSQITLAAWIYPEAYSTDAGGGGIISKECSTESIYSIRLPSGQGLMFRGLVPRSSISYQTTADIPLNQWTFVAATYNGSKVRLYINDTMEEFDETRSLFSQPDYDVYIGSVYSTGRYFDGLIDDAMIFNTALSQDEVATLRDSFTLDWDENGNLAYNEADSSNTIAYTHNWDNKLRKAELTTGDPVEVRYDPDGNRIWRKSTVSSEAVERKYIVDIVGDLPVILMEIDPEDSSIVKSYIHANAQILAQHDGDRTAAKYFYLHDRLGSVRQIVNSSGSVVKYCTFEPFGRTIESGGTFDDPFGFTGQYLDAEIGEYYLRARQYNPTIARFTARDPVFGELRLPLTLHKYLYCGNDPVNRMDLTGEWAFYAGMSAAMSLDFKTLHSDFKSGGLLSFENTIIGHYLYMLPLQILATEHMGFGGTGGLAIALAHDEDQGITKGWSFGTVKYLAGGLVASPGNATGGCLSFDFAISFEAQTVADLGGHFVEVGGSHTFGPPAGMWGLNSMALTYSRGFDKDGWTGINLWTISPGYGAFPGTEGHAYVGHTWASTWWSN